MESSILTAVIASVSALLGGGLTAFVQWRMTNTNQEFQLKLEASRHKADRQERHRHAHNQRVIDAHRILSKIGREFSLTTLDIMWRAEMTEHDYDKRYLAACETVDELRAIADLSIPEISKAVESMYGQMNMFWGNFKELLRLTELGETYDKKQYFLSKAHEAANEIARHVGLAKGMLGTLEQ